MDLENSRDDLLFELHRYTLLDIKKILVKSEEDYLPPPRNSGGAKGNRGIISWGKDKQKA